MTKQIDRRGWLGLVIFVLSAGALALAVVVLVVLGALGVLN